MPQLKLCQNNSVYHSYQVSEKRESNDWQNQTHVIRTGDDNNDWSIEKLESILTDLVDQNIIELIDDTYKIKETQGYTLTEDSRVESITLMVPETQILDM